MPSSRSTSRRPPLKADTLEALALHYVGRYATTRARLADYLRRKLRERGWTADGDPPVDAIIERCVAARYVDDRAFAETRSASLLRRGYGSRRIVQSIRGAGVEQAIAEELAPDRAAALAAAQAYVMRRKVGVSGTGPVDPVIRRRQFAAMLRAGHDYDVVREFLRDPDPGRDE